MSYILEALRKAERERSLGQTPDLRTLHATPTATRRRLWPWLLTAALLLNLIVLVLLVGWPLREPAAPGVAAVPPPAAPVPVTVPTVPVVAPAVVAPAPVVAPPPAPAPVPSSAPRLSQQESPAPAPAPAPAIIPTFHALPAAVRNTLPSLNLDVHVYSEQADKRFVLINGRRYREGDWLEAGPRVEVIEASGVILSHAGQRFRLPVPR